jgi:hypothetical protein
MRQPPSEGYTPRPLTSTLEALERRCPDHVEPDAWRQAQEDGRAFLARWGDRAEAFAWTARDLFGLHPIPNDHGPAYRRFARYDAIGLIWLLRGRQVVALSSTRQKFRPMPARSRAITSTATP